MTNPFADMLKNHIPATANHMTFEEQCGYYGALKSGVPRLAVASAANVATVTVTYLARAGERVGGQIRYRKVASEYADLGHEAFIHKYVTPALRDRCMTAFANYENGVLPERHQRHARRSANSFVGLHKLNPRNEWQIETARVEIAQTPEGYISILLNLGARAFEREHGERLGPFPTSRAAFRAARTKYTPTEDELDAAA